MRLKTSDKIRFRNAALNFTKKMERNDNDDYKKTELDFVQKKIYPNLKKHLIFYNVVLKIKKIVNYYVNKQKY